MTFMTFQTGRRICPGATIARDVLFLSVANLVRKLSFERSSKVNSQDYLTCDVRFITVPNEVPIVVRKRK